MHSRFKILFIKPFSRHLRFDCVHLVLVLCPKNKMMGGGPYDFIARFIYGSPISFLCLFPMFGYSDKSCPHCFSRLCIFPRSLWPPIDFISDVSNWSYLIKRPVLTLVSCVLLPHVRCQQHGECVGFSLNSGNEIFITFS